MKATAKNKTETRAIRFRIPVIFNLITTALLLSCQEKPQQLQEYEVASKWADMTLYVTKNTPQNSPTYASRCFGYIGLTMYETVVPGFASHQSIAGQLNGLSKLPQVSADEEYNWLLALNAGQATIIRRIYNQTSDENKEKIDSLEASIQRAITYYLDNRNNIERSISFGKEVAEHIFEWSKTDGGHRAYLRNFDKEWIHPEFPGSWKPPLYSQSISHHPLHPYWGDNRTFLAENEAIGIPYMIPYDTTPGSPYYEQFLTVYEKDKELTQEDKEIAIWWGDDPDETFTPPGHSYYIANIAVLSKKPTLIKATETYARVGLAVADAFIKCWKWKFHYFSERPNTFIPTFVDQEWASFWPDPPFPCFPSGHAIQAASAATVLEDLYGKEFTFTDTSHKGRERDEIRDVDFKERPFTTFWDVALETANSRFYGGIHVPQDNEVGLREGKRIAENVNNLSWTR